MNIKLPASDSFVCFVLLEVQILDLKLDVEIMVAVVETYDDYSSAGLVLS